MGSDESQLLRALQGRFVHLEQQACAEAVERCQHDAEVTVMNHKIELNAEAMKWKKEECEELDTKCRSANAQHEAGHAQLMNEVSDLNAERANLDAHVRNEAASVRAVSQRLQDERVEVDRAAASIEANQAHEEWRTAELGERLRSSAEAEEKFHQARAELAEATSRISCLEGFLQLRISEVNIAFDEVRGRLAEDRAQIEGLTTRADRYDGYLDDRFSSAADATIEDMRCYDRRHATNGWNPGCQNRGIAVQYGRVRCEQQPTWNGNGRACPGNPGRHGPIAEGA